MAGMYNPCKAPADASSRRITIEPLEGRIAPALVAVLGTPREIVTTLRDSTNSTHTSGSLRDAIFNADAATGATDIVFQTTLHGKPVPLHGVIALNPALGALPPITNDVSIIAPGIAINAEGKLQGLSITNDTAGISISGLAIVNGIATSGGDLSITGGTNITLTGVRILNGRAATGAGIYINDPGATINITKSAISGNRAAGPKGSASAGYAGEGGGIANLGGTLAVATSAITHNSATGGAGDVGGYAGGNAAGGGIFNADTISLTSSTVSGNIVTGGNGGAGIDYGYVAITQTTTQATNGGAGGNAYGGGIANSGGSVTIQKSVISGNTVHGGQGITGGKTSSGTDGASFTVANSTAYPAGDATGGGIGLNGGNGGSGVGGGVGSTGPGSVTVTQSTVTGNIAASGHGGNGSAGGKGGNGGAGGTYNGTTYNAGNGGNGGYGGTAGNAGLAGGAGVYCNGALKIRTSTFTGNITTSGKAGLAGAAGAAGTGYTPGTAGTPGAAGTYHGSRGGAIDSEYGTVFLSEITVAKNTAAFGGGVSVYQDTSAAIHNCTIAFNSATNATGRGGLFISLDGADDPVNVISSIIAMNKVTNIDGTLGSGSSNNLTSGNPLLGVLAFHAPGSTLTTGATQTMLPSKVSPAVLHGPGAAPDLAKYSTDQNGHAFGASISIGSVQIST